MDEVDDDGPVSIHSGLEEVQVSPAAPAEATSPVRKFALSAWYLNKAQSTVATSDPMQWSFQPTLEGKVDPDGVATVSTFPASGSAADEARVSSGSMADTVRLKIWANTGAAAAEGDVIQYRQPPRAVAVPPNVALVEERTAGTCGWGQPRAFVGAAAVGEQSSIPCSLSLLSASHAMVFQQQITDDKWKTNGASFSYTPVTPLPLQVTVFLAVTPPPAGTPASESSATDPEAQAKMDIEKAGAIFEANRTGVKLDVDRYVKLPQIDGATANVGADPYDCVLPATLPSNPNKASYAYNPKRISVYYVDLINFPPDESAARVRGSQCHYWYSGSPGPVVFVSYSRHSSTTLAHELGHALGLNDQWGELGNRDLMHNMLPDGPIGADARSRLTVGQVFRMNVWDDSWVNTRSPPPPKRACDDAQACPVITLDVR